MEPKTSNTTPKVVGQNVLAEATYDGNRLTLTCDGGDLPFTITRSHDFGFGLGEVFATFKTEEDAISCFALFLQRLTNV